MSSQFCKARAEIAKESGQDFLNYKWTNHDGTEDFGVIYNDGLSALLLGGLITKYHWIDELEAEQISCQEQSKIYLLQSFSIFSEHLFRGND